MTAASQLFVDFNNGNDANDGTFGHPVLTVAQLVAMGIPDGATIRYVGQSYGPVLLNDRQYDSIQFIPAGDPQEFAVRGWVAVAPAAWNPGGGNVYTTVLPVGVAGLAALAIDFDTTINADGSHGGDLLAVAIGTVPGTNNTYNYNAGTRTVTANFAGTDPRVGGHVVFYSQTGRVGFSFTGKNSTFLLSCDGWADPAAGLGVGFGGTGTANTLQVAKFFRNGYHSAMWAGNGDNSRSKIIGVPGYGIMAGVGDGGSHMAFYSSAADVLDCASSGLKLLCHGALGRNLQPLAAPVSGYGGTISHSAGFSVNRLNYTGLDIRFPFGEAGSAFDSVNCPAPGNRDDISTYAAKATSCTVTGGQTITPELHFGMDRCTLLMTNSDKYGGLTGAGRAIYGNGTDPTTIGLFACQLVWNLINNGDSGIAVKAGNTVVAHQCTIFGQGAGNVGGHLNILDATALMRVHGSILAYASANANYIQNQKVMLDGGATIAAAKDLADNVYVRAGQGGQSGSDQNLADFIDVRDSAGIITKSSPFLNEATGDLRLNPNHWLYGARKLLTAHAPLGRSGETYAGAYGCNQPQPAPKRPLLWREPRI